MTPSAVHSQTPHEYVNNPPSSAAELKKPDEQPSQALKPTTKRELRIQQKLSDLEARINKKDERITELEGVIDTWVGVVRRSETLKQEINRLKHENSLLEAKILQNLAKNGAATPASCNCIIL